MNDNEAIPSSNPPRRQPWNKGKLIGAKPPLRASHVWSIRTKLQLEKRTRDLALFNLAIDSKLRGCDVVAMRVDDVAPNGYTLDRATIRQKKTGRPVRFELTEQTRQAIDEYLRLNGRKAWRVPVRRSRWQRLWSHNTSICSPGWSVGREHRPRPAQVRHALPAPNQSDIDLSPNRQSARGAIIVGPHEDRKHGSISWHRDRQCD
jgi:integrase